MLLHKLGHIEADKRLGRIKEVLCKALDQLGLSDTCAAGEYERNRLALCADSRAVALDGANDGIDSLVLTYDMRAQTVAERIYACELVLCNGACGNAGPYLDDIRKVGHREADGITLRRQTIKALLHAYLARAQLGYARVSLLVCGTLAARLGLERLSFTAYRGKLGGKLLRLLYHRRGESQMRGSLVEQVYRLVGEKTIGNIPLGKRYRALNGVVGYLDTVKALVVALDTAQYLDRSLNRRLLEYDGLKAALKRRVLLDVLAVLGKGGRAYDLYLAL